MQAQELNSMLDRQEADMQRNNRPQGPAPFGNFGGGNAGGPGPFNRGGNAGGNFRGNAVNDKPLMGPNFGGPGGFSGPGPMPNFDGPFGGANFNGGPGMFNNGPGGPGGRLGPRRWEGNDDNGPMKRRRF
jgi:hypothetical protein